MDEMHMYELYHYGVKGQKWGVRRDRRRANKQQRRENRQQKRQYRKDMRTLQDHRDRATKNAEWLRAYDQKQTSLRKKYEDSRARDRDEGLLVSKKTLNTARKLNALMRYDTTVINENRQSIAECKSYTDKMIKKYGKEKVKSFETQAYKGEQVIKSRFWDGDAAVRSFEWNKKKGMFIPTVTYNT